MNYLMLFVTFIVVLYVWMIVYAIKNAKKAYPSIAHTRPVKKKIKKVKSVVHDNWEGGRTLPRKETELLGEGMADIDQDDALFDVSDGLDGVSFDYDA